MSISSGDVAEQVVKIYLEGVEVALRISGSAAKNVAAAIYAIAKDENRTKGKVRLASMLRNGKDLKIFSVKKDELEKFSKEAKRYGVLYCALLDKNNKDTDDIVDIMVRSEDAPKVNRIVERFNFASVNVADVKKSVDSIEEKLEDVTEPKSEEDLIVEDLLNKQNKIKEQESEFPSINAVGNNQSEPSLEKQRQILKDNTIEVELNAPEEIIPMNSNLQLEQKHSVRAELKSIQEELKAEVVSTELIEVNSVQQQKAKGKRKFAKHSKNRDKNKKIAKHLKQTNRGGR